LNDAISLENVSDVDEIGDSEGLLSDFNQNCLDARIAVPVAENGELLGVDLSIYSAHERQIHSGDKLDFGRSIWIAFAAVDLEAVDTVLVHGLIVIHQILLPQDVQHEDTYMARTDDCTVPVTHQHIVAILQSVGTRAIAYALLALL